MPHEMIEHFPQRHSEWSVNDPVLFMDTDGVIRQGTIRWILNPYRNSSGVLYPLRYRLHNVITGETVTVHAKSLVAIKEVVA